jgi:callose synthase
MFFIWFYFLILILLIAQQLFRLFLFHRKRRLYSGFMFSGVAAFVTYTFLQPLFVPVRSEIAMVFMYILVFDSAMVGMALGVLLPLIFPGVCLGALVGLLGVVMSGTWNAYLFPITGAVLAVILAIVSSR